MTETGQRKLSLAILNLIGSMGLTVRIKSVSDGVGSAIGWQTTITTSRGHVLSGVVRGILEESVTRALTILVESDATVAQRVALLAIGEVGFN